MFSQYCRDASNNSATTNEGEFVILLKQDVCTKYKHSDNPSHHSTPKHNS
jgi:hypothetical protein